MAQNMNTGVCPAMKLPPYHVFNQQIQSCWTALQGTRKIAVYQGIVQLTGSIKAAIMLSQLLYWTRVSTDVSERDGWLYKTIAEMEAETGLTKREQGVCKEKLYELNLIRTCRVGVGARLAFKVNLDELALGICRLYDCDPTSVPPLTIEDIHNSQTLVYRQFFASRFVYQRDLFDLTGCLNAAIMLSQMLHIAFRNTNHADETKEYACSSIAITEWEKSIGLSHKSQLNARNKLKILGFIVEKNLQGDRRIFTLVNAKAILDALSKKVKSKKELPLYPPQPQRVQAHYKKMAQNSMIQKLPLDDKPNVFSDPESDEKKGKMDDTKREEWKESKGKNGQPRGLQGNAITFTFSINNDSIMPISEVTKGKVEKLQNGKFKSNTWRNSEVTKGGILFNINYKVYNYNYKYGVLPSNFGLQSEQNPVVVVVEENVSCEKKPEQSLPAQNQKIASHDAKLIMPSCFTDSVKDQVLSLWQKELPNTNPERMQEILDEIAGQQSEVRSPIGLFIKLLKLEQENKLICIMAREVREAREKMQKAKGVSMSLEEWQSLPSGTAYRHKDGSIWVKDKDGFLRCDAQRRTAIPQHIPALLASGHFTLMSK